MQSRRQFLQHLGALGLGLVLLPAQRAVAQTASPSAAPKLPGHLILVTVEAGGLAHYSYFLGDKKAGVAVVIDPRRDVDVYLDLARKHGLTITHALDTHIHADFLSGARELSQRTGTAEVCLSVEGDPSYGFSFDRALRHGDTIRSGDLLLKTLHTPGHTPEHVSFVASTGTAPREPWALFTGDFLFVGSVGRPDLMGVENTDRLANALFHTVENGYRELPDELPIYPAHGPGSPCGAGILKPTGLPTLGQQRATNPYLNLNDRDLFIEHLLFAQPPVPYYWPRMKVANAEGPEILGRLPELEMLPPKQFASYLEQQDVQLLDTRNLFEFAGGHIPGSLSIGYDPVLSLWGGWTLDPDKPIALVLPASGKGGEVAAWLARVGLEKGLTVGLKGGLREWINEGHRWDAFEAMSIHEVRKTFPTDSMQLLDVRQPSEWDQGHLAGAQYMFLPEIPQRLNELDRSRPVVVYCGNGYRASIAVSLLRREGFDARGVPGSYTAWLAAGYPVERPAESRPASDTRRAAS